jgi:hypothetical protein
MSEEKSEAKNNFPYTHGSYWEGSSLPFIFYVCLAVFPLTGFFGIDQLLFFSPKTAVQKALINMCTLGLWYFYDMMQVFGDRKYIEEYGLSRPLFGASGLAYQFFNRVTNLFVPSKDDLPQGESFMSIAFFMAYFMTLYVPFGLSSFLAGDMNGGIAKFVLTILFFTIPFLFLWNIFEFCTVLWNPVDSFEKGVPRIPPFTATMDSRGLATNFTKPSVLKEMGRPSGTIFSRLFGSLFSFFGIPDPFALISATTCAVVPPIQSTVSAVTTAASGVAGLVGSAPKVAAKVAGKMAAFSDPTKLAALAEAPILPIKLGPNAQAAMSKPIVLPPTFTGTPTQAVGTMVGGGSMVKPLDSWFLISIGFLIVGGFAIAGIRGLRNMSLQKDRNDYPPSEDKRDDTPPQPRNV